MPDHISSNTKGGQATNTSIITPNSPTFASITKQNNDTNANKIYIELQQPIINNDVTNMEQEKLPKVNDPQFKQKWDNIQITKNHGVAFPVINEMQQSEFLDILLTAVEPEKIFSFSRTARRFVIYFTTTNIANDLLINGLSHEGIWLQAQPVEKRATRVILSDIFPHIPQREIILKLKEYGDVTTEYLRPIPINTNGKAQLTHVVSHRREIFMDIKKILPSKIVIKSDGDSYEISVSTELTCKICRSNAHETEKCIYQSANNRISRCQKCMNIGHSSETCTAFPSLVNQPSTSNMTSFSLTLSEPRKQPSQTPTPQETMEFESDEIMKPPQINSKRGRSTSRGVNHDRESPPAKVQQINEETSDTEQVLDKLYTINNDPQNIIIELMKRSKSLHKFEKIKSLIDETKIPLPSLVQGLLHLKATSQTVTDKPQNLNQRIDRMISFIEKDIPNYNKNHKKKL